MLGPAAGLKEGSEFLRGPSLSSASRSDERLLPTEEEPFGFLRYSRAPKNGAHEWPKGRS